MNVVGTCMWLAVGGTAIHYWSQYVPEFETIPPTSERAVGITVGVLSIVSGILYCVDSIFAFVHYARE